MQASERYSPCSCCKHSTHNNGVSERGLTGSAGVTALCGDISKLLNQGAEKLARLQSVLAGPLSPAGVWRNVRETQARRRSFAEPSIEQLHFPSLIGLQLRDLPQMSEGMEAGICCSLKSKMTRCFHLKTINEEKK